MTSRTSFVCDFCKADADPKTVVRINAPNHGFDERHDMCANCWKRAAAFLTLESASRAAEGAVAPAEASAAAHIDHVDRMFREHIERRVARLEKWTNELEDWARKATPI